MYLSNYRDIVIYLGKIYYRTAYEAIDFKFNPRKYSMYVTLDARPIVNL